MLSDYEFPEDDVNYSMDNFEDSQPKNNNVQQEKQKNAPVLGANKDFFD